MNILADLEVIEAIYRVVGVFQPNLDEFNEEFSPVFVDPFWVPRVMATRYFLQ